MIKQKKISIRQELKAVPMPEDCFSMKDCDNALKECKKIIDKFKQLNQEVPTSLFNRFVNITLKEEKIYLNNLQKNKL